ncbi:MAG: flavin-dependent dehydrogenase [Planctomycetaceae bacterium]|jgi:flavin-dependent dehydrogenase
MNLVTACESTIDASNAADTEWDVVVIGAGPAGALTATLLARRGLKTLLVEKRVFPRYKVCGACLNPLSLTLLASAGLAHVVADAVPLDRFCLQSSGGTLTLDLPGSVSLSREQLDARLAQAAIDAGAMFLSGCSAKVLPLENGRNWRVCPAPQREVELTTGDRNRIVVETAVVVAADGLTHGSLSQLKEFNTQIVEASRLGAGTVVEKAPAFYEPGCIHMASARAGYVGLVRLEDGRLNVAAALDSSAVEKSGSLAETARRVIESAGFPPIESLREAEWTGTPSLTRETRPLASQRVFLVGDAAGYVEPFTGEGMAWALASATSVVPLVQCACERWDSILERTWNDDWQRNVGRHLGWCRRLAQLLRHPVAVSALTRLLATCPWLAQPVLRRLNRIPQPDSQTRYNSETVQSETVQKAAG